MNKITLGFFLAKSKATIKELLMLFAFLLMNTQVSWGQSLLVDDFTGTLASNLTANGWTAHSGSGTAPVTIASPGLTYTGYLSSGLGNATSASGNGEDINKAFTATNSGSVYYSFMVNASPTATTTDYSMHLCQSSGSAAAGFFGRVFIQKDATTNLRFGLTKASAAASAVNTAYSYSTGTTYLVVVKYTFNTGTTTNDSVDMWVNPTPGSSEPTPTISVASEAVADATTFTAIAIRQFNASTLARFDGIRVGTTWASVTPAAVSGTPSPTITADATSNTVDNAIDITFTDNSAWRAAVTAVKIGTTTLISGTDYDLTAGNLQLKPSGLNALLTTSGSKAVTVVAAGYTDATVTQVINAGEPIANSTATISAALATNTSRTITCTAKDQYNNLVSGYTFAYDVTITNNSGTTAESYTIDGSPFTATSTSGNPVVATTNASGVATFDAVLPAIIDANDGINIQVQLNDDTTNIGTVFSFTQLASQTITFDTLSPVTYGDASFDLTATASSTLPVTYTSSNTAVATVLGSTVTIVGAGSTNITASQAGNGSYNAAINVIQSLTVNAIALTLPDAAAASRSYNGLLTTDIIGTLSGIINADDVTLVGTVKGIFADANVANGIAVTSGCTLTGLKAGNYTLTQPTGLTANITQASQTITFGALANKIMGAAPFALSATASSTLTVTYVSSNTAVATVSGSTVTVVGVGSTNITASQIGDVNYASATDVVQSLTVVPLPLVAWQFGSPAALGTEVTYNATINDTNLNTVVLSRGSGILPTALGRGFAANSWDNGGTKTTAVSTTEYFEFVVNVKSGFKLNLTALDATIRRSSATAPNAYIWKYSTDGTNFTEIGTDVSYTGTSEGVSQPQIDLSAISALQNVENNTSLTFRLYAWGGTSTTSTFSIGRYGAGVTTNSLSISGTIEAATSTTWNGTTWSNGMPTASLEAIIDGTYITKPIIDGGNDVFTAKKLTVNSGKSLTINSGTSLTVQNEVINNGNVVVENNANLIQVNNTTNSGNITVNRNSNPLYRLDYTIWSSPVASQNLLAFSPLTSVVVSPPSSRFYNYDTTSNLYSTITDPSAATFASGAGYLIRMPNTDPLTGYDAGTATLAYPGVFAGVPNNGNVPVTLNYVDALHGYNMVGNPYSSTIDANTFITANTANIESTLYFWRKKNGSGTAYAAYNPLGGTLTYASTTSEVPNGKIQVGQGFFVQAKSAGNVPAFFTNAMRDVSPTSTQFFKTKQVAQKDRVWLNLTNATGVFSQALVGYVDGASQDVDIYDGKYINDSQIALTSNINNEEYSIQGRPAFDPSDIVALSFKTNVAGDYNIAIDHADGLFANGQDVYLVDSKTGADTNLKTSSYNFSAAAGVDNARFSLKYQKTLGTNNAIFNDNSVTVYKNKGTLYVNSGSIAINNIKVFDVQGRLIAEQKNVKANTATIKDLKATQQVLIVKITSQDNKVVSKKVVN